MVFLAIPLVYYPCCDVHLGYPHCDATLLGNYQSYNHGQLLDYLKRPCHHTPYLIADKGPPMPPLSLITMCKMDLVVVLAVGDWLIRLIIAFYK